jgi:hypothetical protein
MLACCSVYHETETTSVFPIHAESDHRPTGPIDQPRSSWWRGIDGVRSDRFVCLARRRHSLKSPACVPWLP